MELDVSLKGVEAQVGHSIWNGWRAGAYAAKEWKGGVAAGARLSKTWSIVLLALLLPVSAWAEPTYPWPAARRPLAGRLSDAAAWSNVAFDTVHSWRSADRGAAFRCQALRMGVSVGSSLLVKQLVQRQRPDGSDRASFFSAHTANAFAASGWRLQVGVPLALGAGYLRTAADKHYISDVLVGAGVGLLASRVC